MGIITDSKEILRYKPAAEKRLGPVIVGVNAAKGEAKNELASRGIAVIETAEQIVSEASIIHEAQQVLDEADMSAKVDQAMQSLDETRLLSDAEQAIIDPPAEIADKVDQAMRHLDTQQIRNQIDGIYDQAGPADEHIEDNLEV